MSYTRIDPVLQRRVVAVGDVYSSIQDAGELFWYVQDFLTHLGGKESLLEAPRDEYEAWVVKFRLHGLWVVVTPSLKLGYAIQFEIEDYKYSDTLSFFHFMSAFLEAYRERWLDLKSKGSIPPSPF